MPTHSPSTAFPDDLVEVGRVVSAYGLRGWIKVVPYSADADVLLTAKKWWLRTPVPPNRSRSLQTAPAQLYTVVRARPHSATVVAQFQGFDNRDPAELLKAHTVWVSRADFPAASDDEHYWVDLIDCQVYGDQQGESVPIGKVVNVFDNGAHAVLELHTGAVNKNNKPIVELVPFVEAYVHQVDTKAKRIDTSWPVDYA